MTKEEFIKLSDRCPMCKAKTEFHERTEHHIDVIIANCPACSWKGQLRLNKQGG